MSNYTLPLTENLYQYLLSVSLREPTLLYQLREETAQLPSHQMQISPEQGQFMALLVELMGAKKILEVGTYTGYSSLALALALPEDGKIIACDINQEWTDIAKKYWRLAKVESKIELRLAPALETLEQLINANQKETFDFVFIDADKSNYAAYYEKCLLLIRSGGLIVIDNTLWGGDVADPNILNASTESIRAFNQKLFSDERVSLSLLPISDGMTLARKR